MLEHRQIRQWDMHISSIIWNKKRPWVKFSKLQSLQSLRDYFWSAKLRSLVFQCNPSYDVKLNNTELSSIDTPIWLNLTLKVQMMRSHFSNFQQVKLLRWLRTLTLCSHCKIIGTGCMITIIAQNISNKMPLTKVIIQTIISLSTSRVISQSVQ